MATTTNFGWETPDDTDLVKDGAAAIRTALGGVDTSFVDLKGGTTGQVLAKASNTDLDFVWSADAAGMTNPMTTTGDTIYSSSGSTPARLGIGSTGQVLTVSGGVPAWATPSSGAFTLISTTSMSGSGTISLTSIPSTYQDLRIVVSDYYPSAANALRLGINSDTSSFYNTVWWEGSPIGSTSAWDTSRNANGLALNINNGTYNADNNNYAIIDIYNYAGNVQKPLRTMHQYKYSAGATQAITMRDGTFETATAISSVQIYVSSGTFSGGTVYLYGVK